MARVRCDHHSCRLPGKKHAAGVDHRLQVVVGGLHLANVSNVPSHCTMPQPQEALPRPPAAHTEAVLEQPWGLNHCLRHTPVVLGPETFRQCYQHPFPLPTLPTPTCGLGARHGHAALQIATVLGQEGKAAHCQHDGCAGTHLRRGSNNTTEKTQERCWLPRVAAPTTLWAW
jgi:hypothetical protein